VEGWYQSVPAFFHLKQGRGFEDIGCTGKFWAKLEAIHTPGPRRVLLF
jgi:hypothetical protein